MDAALQQQMTIAALVCSIAALFFSLFAAFPGLKAVLAAIRDGVLWFALFLVLGGVAFVGWERIQELPKPSGSKLGQASSLTNAASPAMPSGKASKIGRAHV